ncbi:MAG: hypothetical protein WBG50_26730 [Desulfomonilaceae bacterium]
MDVPADKMNRWITARLEGIDDLDEEVKFSIAKRAGELCAADLMALCEKHLMRKRASASDLVARWNELRRQRNRAGRWELNEGIVTTIFPECGCPLVRSGMIELHPVQCHCSQSMIESIFSRVCKRPVRVLIRRLIGNGDGVCEFLIST